MRILLVEDDPMIGEAVQAALKDASYAADRVTDGALALTAFAAQRYDLILLDLGLPGRDGLDVLASIRAKGSAVPVIIITARDGLDDRLRGLDGGADDYILKLFEMAELLARIRVAIRRQAEGEARGESVGNEGTAVRRLSTASCCGQQRRCPRAGAGQSS